MSLEKLCSLSVAKAIRTRGDAYFREGRVDIVFADEQSLEALVKGSDTYYIEMELKKVSRRFRILASCSCRYFSRGDLCKHVWAVLLAAQKEGWAEGAASGNSPLTVQWNDPIEDEDDDNFFDDFFPVTNSPRSFGKARQGIRLPTTPRNPSPPDWKKALNGIRLMSSQFQKIAKVREDSSSQQEIWYAVNLDATKAHADLTIDLFQRERRTTGTWGVIKTFKVDRAAAAYLGNETDRNILELLLGRESEFDSPYYGGYFSSHPIKQNRFIVSPKLCRIILPELANTGRLTILDFGEGRPQTACARYENEAWQFELQLSSETGTKSEWTLRGFLRRDDERIRLDEPKLFLSNGLVIFDRSIARLDRISVEDFPWIACLRDSGAIRIPVQELDRFIETSLSLPSFPRIEWPRDCGWRKLTGTPKPRLSIFAKSSYPEIDDYLAAKIYHDYDGKRFEGDNAKTTWLDKQEKCIWQRDLQREDFLFSQLLKQPRVIQDVGQAGTGADVRFPVQDLSVLTAALLEAGWVVEAEGSRVRQAGAFEAFVSSGVDWFDLTAKQHFEDESIGLPALLKALEQGERFVRLGDGSVGLLPTDWIKKFSQLTEFGKLKKNGLRFNRDQAVLLNALLEELPVASFDQKFAELRTRIQSFQGIQPKDARPDFQGKLRGYQREGIGWLAFLREFRLGGCLADDMGLGKTVQVLAMIHYQSTKNRRQGTWKPSLIVVPRSLVANWLSEAQRFCPRLRVVDHSEFDRHEKWQDIVESDLVITTYGILRRDIEKFRSMRFDYAILDEAQAIKNETSQVARASRLIHAEHRLALTGTPVENHLGELGSIFEFLNPGMLNPTWLADLSRKSSEEGREVLAILSKALRPFILRRTKDQVLKELPPKIEQTILCDLEMPQRKLYDELRKYYQSRLTDEIQKQGINRSKIHVLEALLRLRQAACHPGLVDSERKQDSSAKLDLLLEKIREIVEGGHKALVFSQFTSMLALVRERLDKEKIRYEYLDGKTRDREAKVQSFQNNSSIPLFLISLKAGGVGLNLTAADYCFILDPWWNPATEAQAIDRAHRIGQTRQVFAYRLIAKDTVEEKILALQEKKRDLADAIISAENTILKNLSLDDLQLLLS